MDSKPPERLCARTGCTRPRAPRQGRTGHHRTCSILCHFVDLELRHVEQDCKRSTNPAAAAELWASAVQLSDSLTDLRRQHRRLRQPTQDHETP